jgi:D-alanine-D-alanine ligase-like ATP-grasp enzyme/acylphosphatase
LNLALAFAARIGYPVVVKPAAGVRGIGVVTNISNEEELREAFDLYARNPLGLDDLIVEQHVSGEDYRIVVVGDEVVSAIRREPASITGDGVHSVADLILFKNRIRTLNPHLRKRLIQYDDAARQLLLRANLALLSVPSEGQLLQLAYSNNISRGGDSIEVVDQLHPSIRNAAIRAVKAIPALEFCGLDFLLEDHTKPLHEQNAAVIELNAHGAIGTGQYPIWGTPRNVARMFLLHCAKRKGVELRFPPADHLALELKIRGRVTGVGYRRWLTRKAEEYGVSATATNVDSMTVKATIEGQLAPVAALANASVRGPHSSAPFWVAIEHVQKVVAPQEKLL